MNEKTNDMETNMPIEKENTRYSHRKNFKKNFVKGKNEEKIKKSEKTDRPEKTNKKADGLDRINKKVENNRITNNGENSEKNRIRNNDEKSEKNRITNNGEKIEKNSEIEKTVKTRVRRNSTTRSTKQSYNKQLRNSKYNVGFKKSNVKIIAIGGLDEIGKNITIIEYENERI